MGQPRRAEEVVLRVFLGSAVACLLFACAAPRPAKVSEEEGLAFERKTLAEWDAMRAQPAEKQCVDRDLIERLGVVERRACSRPRTGESARNCFFAGFALRDALGMRSCKP